MERQHPLPHSLSASVSEAEYRVLCCLELEGGLIDADGVSGLADAIWTRVPLPAAQYAAASGAVIERGWVKVITEADRCADILRWADEPHQTLSETPYRVGSLDFTLEGWGIFRELAQHKHGMSYEARYKKHSQIIWDVPGRMSLLSLSEGTLNRELEAVRAGTDEIVFGEASQGLRAQHTLGEIVGPYSLGPWWLNRFYHAPSGYRLDIAFDPADLHADAQEQSDKDGTAGQGD